jgi:hypothetical protein
MQAIRSLKLLDLAPDIQEQIHFLRNIKGLNETNLRPIVRGSTGTSSVTMSYAMAPGCRRALSDHGLLYHR